MPTERCILSQPSADSSLCGGSLWRSRVCGRGISPLRRRGGGRSPSGSFPIAPATPSVRLLCILAEAQRWQVAAALSAAVTTTKPIGDAPTFQAEPTQKKDSTRTPAALRERGSGGEALLSEKRPLPQRLPNIVSREGSAREGLLEKKPPPSQYFIPVSFVLD